MEEAQDTLASSVKQVKENKSFLADDTMDFDFGTVSSGKKKAFDFGKLDMDFNLDDGFDKLSSFNVDMPDLDFSCPSKKVAKQKEISEGEQSSGDRQRKQNSFSISFDKFDFSELDNFNFDSAVLKGDKTSKRDEDLNGTALGKNGQREPKIKWTGYADTCDMDHGEKLPASVSAPGDTENCSPLSSSETTKNLVVIPVEKTSTEKTIHTQTKEPGQGNSSPNKEFSPGPCAEYTILPHQNDDSTYGGVSHELGESGILGAYVNAKSDSAHIVNDRKISSACSNQVNPQPKCSASLLVNDSENNAGDKANVGAKILKEPGNDDFEREPTSTENQPGIVSHDHDANNEGRNSILKVLAPIKSKTVDDKLIKMKGTESAVGNVKLLRRSKEAEHLCQTPSSGLELCTIGNKGTASIHLNSPENGRREDSSAVSDSQIGKKLVGDIKPPSRESAKDEAASLDNEKNAKNPTNRWKVFVERDGKRSCELGAVRRSNNEEVSRSGSAELQTEKDIRNINNVGNLVNPTSTDDKKTKSNNQTSTSATPPVSIMRSLEKSKIISAERVRSAIRTPNLSGLKTSRITGASKDLFNASIQKETNSSTKLDENMDPQANAISEIVNPAVAAERKIPLVTSLKRKTFEEMNADLTLPNPSKRLSPSLSERNRSYQEPVECAIKVQVSTHVNRPEGKIKNSLAELPNHGPDVPRKVSMLEIDISSSVDSNEYVEKAEAYAKELENICNMLRKKHEEAKEIMVQAIVNNNNLLMLNHPIFDEKIRVVQKFTAELLH